MATPLRKDRPQEQPTEDLTTADLAQGRAQNRPEPDEPRPLVGCNRQPRRVAGGGECGAGERDAVSFGQHGRPCREVSRNGH